MKIYLPAILVVIAVGAAGCHTPSESPGGFTSGNTGFTSSTSSFTSSSNFFTSGTSIFTSGPSDFTSTSNPSVAYMLAVIDGDPSEEAAFQEAIDCIMASGIKGAETEEKVGDTLYASWKESSQEVSLLEWAQILCTG